MFAEITVCFEQIDSVVEEQPDALTRLEAKEQTYSIFSIETGSTKQNKTKQNKTREKLMEPSLRSGATWESRKLTRSKNPFQAPRDFLGMEPGKACFEPRFRLESSEISEVFVSNFFLVKLVNKPVSSCTSW